MPLPQNMDLTDLCRFRTKKCQRKSTQGHCELDVRCPFSHCLSWHRRNPLDFEYSQHLCPNVDFRKEAGRMRVRNRCANGRSCKFAHTKEEQMYHPFVYKTQLCRDHPKCEKAYCPFAHDLEDMRRSQSIEDEMNKLRKRKTMESLHMGAIPIGTLHYDSPPTRSPPGIDFISTPQSAGIPTMFHASESTKIMPPNPSPRSCSMSTTSSRTNESPRTFSVLSPACAALPSWGNVPEDKSCGALPETVPEETPHQLLESDLAEGEMLKDYSFSFLFDMMMNYYNKPQHESQNATSAMQPVFTTQDEALLNSIKDLRSELPAVDNTKNGDSV